MNATSRTPRLRVVGKKNIARSKRAPNKRPLTEADRRDSAGLKRVIAQANAGLVGRALIGASKLARFAVKFGGSKYPQQWSDYINGKERIPLVDKLIVCVYFPEYRPQDIFASWLFSMLTPLPAKSRIPFLVHLITAVSMAGAEQQDLLCTLVALFLKASRPQRDALIRKAQALVNGSD